ncbi:hypothetical protein HK101_007884 [Irineochytrium annulatum]|nr:hypothetical protein HK101_007884 [Irineochytrium annulatum]
MANIFANGARTFNQRGQNVYDRLSAFVGILFFIIMIFYAGFRGHRVVTQLPATFRTTTLPAELPVTYLNDLFPSQVPAATYEFPALLICAMDSAASVQLVSCDKAATATLLACDHKGNANVTVTFDHSEMRCITVNNAPGLPLIADVAEDEIIVKVAVTGTRDGQPQGVMVTMFDQGKSFNPNFENYFVAATSAATEVSARKVIDIAMDGTYAIEFEARVTSVPVLNVPVNSTNIAEITVQYPNLEVMYEKEFLPLDMNNWLGEVGGVAALLMMLHQTFAFVLQFVLLRVELLAETKQQRLRNTEGF